MTVAADLAPEEDVLTKPPSRLRARLRKQRSVQVWSGVLGLIVLACLVGPLLLPHEPNTGDLMRTLEQPSGDHWLGTDSLGRDVLTRILFGGRVALGAALEALVVALAIGLPLGLWLGYRGGWVDRIGMRVVEALVSLPFLIVTIAVMSIIGTGLVKSMAIVGVIYAMYILRLVRGLMLSEREAGYVDAARVAGLRPRRIVLSEALPNIAPPVIVQVTQLFASAIIIEATLSFLGFGVRSPTASWGSMLSIAQESIRQESWQSIPPGVAIFVTALAFNQLGDGVRDIFAREAKGGNLGITTRRGRSRRAATGADDRDLAIDLGPVRTRDDLLVVSDLTVQFPGPDGAPCDVVRSVDLTVGRGEVVALVGESGSGKTVSAMAVAGLVPAPGVVRAERIVLDGRRIDDLTFDEHRKVRGDQLGIVFQEPIASLNPALTVGEQVAEVVRQHRRASRRAARAEVVRLFERVGIPDAAGRYDDHPHRFSGGMAQRVMIAMALAGEPRLLIADEPTTALDVTVQSQILDLLLGLRDTDGLAILLITHDLGVVADVADRVVVMYAGEVVEEAGVLDLFAAPAHPYSRGLLAAMPRNEPRTGRLPAIEGTVPPPWRWPTGCHFADRCPEAEPACTGAPVAMVVSGTGRARCVHVSVPVPVPARSVTP